MCDCRCSQQHWICLLWSSWLIIPCSLVCGYNIFARIYCLLPQGRIDCFSNLCPFQFLYWLKVPFKLQSSCLWHVNNRSDASALNKEEYFLPELQLPPITLPLLPGQCRTHTLSLSPTLSLSVFNLAGICSLTGLNCTSCLDNQTRSQISCYSQYQESLFQELNQGMVGYKPSTTTTSIRYWLRMRGCVSPLSLMYS